MNTCNLRNMQLRNELPGDYKCDVFDIYLIVTNFGQLYSVRITSTSGLIMDKKWAFPSEKGFMIIFEAVGREISIIDYYKNVQWFVRSYLRKSTLRYFAKTSETYIWHFLLWRHILRHLRHLLALRQKSRKPTFRSGQLICLQFLNVFSVNCDATLNKFFFLLPNCFVLMYARTM